MDDFVIFRGTFHEHLKIDKFKHPETKEELKIFLGLAGFYRSFIPNFARSSHPLNRLTSDTLSLPGIILVKRPLHIESASLL